MNYCNDSLGYKYKLLIQCIYRNSLQYPTSCHINYVGSFHFVIETCYSNVVLHCRRELYHIPIYIPVELQIKYEHSNGNLECIN